MTCYSRGWGDRQRYAWEFNNIPDINPRVKHDYLRFYKKITGTSTANDVINITDSYTNAEVLSVKLHEDLQ